MTAEGKGLVVRTADVLCSLNVCTRRSALQPQAENLELISSVADQSPGRRCRGARIVVG